MGGYVTIRYDNYPEAVLIIDARLKQGFKNQSIEQQQTRRDNLFSDLMEKGIARAVRDNGIEALMFSWEPRTTTTEPSEVGQ